MDFMLPKEENMEIVPYACGENNPCEGCTNNCKGCRGKCEGCSGTFIFG